MKKTSVISIIFCLFCFSSFSQQAKTPKLMVIPMDIWCQEHGFWDIYEDQGAIKGSPNYERAVQDSRDLMMVISQINALFQDRGYKQLADLSQSIKNNQRRSARNLLTVSQTSNSELAANSLDELNRQVRADIYVEVDWSINITGPKKSISYNLRALDAYTGEPIANAQGTGTPSYSAEIPLLIEEAVVAHMDGFLSQLQSYFDDCINNGRKVSIEVSTFNNERSFDLETEFMGTELCEIIEDWMNNHTVNHQFLLTEKTENAMLFEGARIPLFKDSGIPQDAGGFVNDLRKYLKTTYHIDSKNNSPSLGYAQIIIGEK